jgi:hypothetical protein
MQRTQGTRSAAWRRSCLRRAFGEVLCSGRCRVWYELDYATKNILSVHGDVLLDQLHVKVAGERLDACGTYVLDTDLD